MDRFTFLSFKSFDKWWTVPIGVIDLEYLIFGLNKMKATFSIFYMNSALRSSSILALFDCFPSSFFFLLFSLPSALFIFYLLSGNSSPISSSKESSFLFFLYSINFQILCLIFWTGIKRRSWSVFEISLFLLCFWFVIILTFFRFFRVHENAYYY